MEFRQSADGWVLVYAQIVHHNDIASGQGGEQCAYHEVEEPLHVDGALVPPALLSKQWGSKLSHSCWQRGALPHRTESQAHSKYQGEEKESKPTTDKPGPENGFFSFGARE